MKESCSWKRREKERKKHEKKRRKERGQRRRAVGVVLVVLVVVAVASFFGFRAQNDKLTKSLSIVVIINIKGTCNKLFHFNY
jgi:hypothetical protein